MKEKIKKVMELHFAAKTMQETTSWIMNNVNKTAEVGQVVDYMLEQNEEMIRTANILVEEIKREMGKTITVN